LSGGSADRLLKEARVIAGLEHPNIVTLFDYGEVDGSPFLVMQLVEGANLSTYHPQELQEIISIALQICSGLSHAHQHGVIHRDLKPENVFLSQDQQKNPSGQHLQVKIVDFGIAHSDLAEKNSSGGDRRYSILYGTRAGIRPEYQPANRPVCTRRNALRNVHWLSAFYR